MNVRRDLLTLASPLLLAGCDATRAPYVVFLNSYFPSWLACAVAGCVAAIAMRVVLVQAGIDEHIPLRFLAYLAFAAAVMFVLSLTLFSR